ncbi:hypothetical protein NEFER03_0710 [Nematocida sp. LUAm3]|nr:hypothetical protein NEFER03_0710 [Nematocida sp. LUAm3]KAI5175169.1 hypothetical protein NEFER02_1130 [Nematocida sp. LUAm2]KAI5178159.1 hypothetical protein NEFER01_1337 [Nematocida sp. LUAm1]
MSTLLEFLNEAKEMSEAISRLSEHVKRAKSLRRDSNTAPEETQREITQKIHFLAKEFKEHTSHVKLSLSHLKEQNERHLMVYGVDRGFIARNTHLQTLLKRLAYVIEEFRRVQKEYAVTQEERMKEYFLIINPKASQEELSSLRTQSKDTLQELFTAGTKTEKESIMHAERKRVAIQEIHQSIEEIKALSEDISEFVVTNGQEVERVHVEVKATSSHAKCSEKALERAAVTKIRIENAKKTTALLLSIILALIFLYVICKVT